jgi:hypothetical protein
MYEEKARNRAARAGTGGVAKLRNA